MTSNTSSTLVIIPARMESSRLAGKPLLMAGDRPLVHWTYDRARGLEVPVLVATPDREIGQYCQDHHIPWRPTWDKHSTGTHRCAEILQQMRAGSGIKTVVNWQCDEPEVPIKAVRTLIHMVEGTHTIGTLVSNCPPHLRTNENTVKCVVGETGRCWWFSRHNISGIAHCGVYAFPIRVLHEVGTIKPTRLSKEMGLEQLAWLENEYMIWSFQLDELPASINTEEDLFCFRRSKEGEGC